MGEAQGCRFEPTFNRSVKVGAGDDRLTSDAGVLLVREADQRLGLTASLAEQLSDPRDPVKIRYQMSELLRERLYALTLGYENQDDVDRLAHDPAMRMAVWDRRGQAVLQERLASQPTQSRLIDVLAHGGRNLNVLRDALGDWVFRHIRSTNRDARVPTATIDVDSFAIEVHGSQEGAQYNGHYRQTGYHPLVASFVVGGDYDGARDGLRLGNGFVHAVLRAGNVHTAKGVFRFVRSVLTKTKDLARELDFRLDAGYTGGEVLDFLAGEKARFLGRLPTNPVLERLAASHLRRPPGRPPREGYETIVELGQHRAESWQRSYRLILVVVDRPDPKTGQLTLQPDFFFLITNWPVEQRTAEQLLEHYRKRGTFEDRLGEFREAVGPHLSSPKFVENEALLLLSLLAFNLGSFLRLELEDDAGACLDLQRFQKVVLKAGGRVVKHARQLHVHVAQAVVPLWNRLWKRLQRWRLTRRRTTPTTPRRRDWVPPPRHAHLAEVLNL
jgi:hypothetical protein